MTLRASLARLPGRRATVIGRLRRNTELGLILLGAIVTAGAYTLASLASSASLPANIVPFLGVVLGLVGAAHLVNRRLAPNADGVLLPVAALLNGLGYVFIARLDEDLAGLQATWTAVGIAAYIATLVVVRRTRILERYRYTFMLVGIGLLVVPLVPFFGREIHGARIWASIGPINFQPGEFAKIALAIFFAGYLVEKRELLAMTTWRVGPVMLPDPKHLGPVLVAWGASLMVMILEKDLGSSLLFFALFIAMLWVATGRAAYLAVGFGLFGVGAWAAWTQFSHVQQRVTIWLDPWRDFEGDGFQVAQAIFAFAWGGVTGTGLGLGSQVRIPERETDFIFAMVGEELGLAGTSVIIMAYLLMVGAGLRIALRADGAFEKLLATGLTTLIGVQAFIIIGGVTRLLPLTGITLPFVSYGGSSLVANYILLALLIRISDQETTREAEKLQAQRAHRIDGGRAVNRQIRRLGIALVGCYVAVFVMLNYWQVIEADELNDHPRNTRAIVRDFNAPRGTISTADDVVVAESVEIEGGPFEQQRRYLEPELFADVTGYYSFNLGATGVERQYNAELSGRTIELQLRSLGDLFIDRDTVGNVTLTLRKDLQELARGALGEQEGSVVALDPRSGAILALWSFPSYDPNAISSHDTAAAIAAKRTLEQDPAKPLVAHTFQDRYFPGSTFKIVTASAGLETGLVTPDNPVYPSVGSFTPPQTNRPINNFGGGSNCGGALFEVLARSCNSAFAKMAVDVGADAMIAEAEAYGFNATPPIDLPGAIESVYPTDFEQNIPALAQTGIGQNEVQATPLQMALVAAAVGNGGKIMAPHVLADVRDDEGDVVRDADPSVWREPLDAEDAAILRQAMIGVVQNGTATRLAVDGWEVGGKTGTAQTGGEGSGDHAWIIGFAGQPGEPARVAVAVFIKAKPGQGEQTGGTVAAPIAQQVLVEALEIIGD